MLADALRDALREIERDRVRNPNVVAGLDVLSRALATYAIRKGSRPIVNGEAYSASTLAPEDN